MLNENIKASKIDNGLEFSAVLSSSIHDMKNGLCFMIQSIENLSEKLNNKGSDESSELAKIHYEASRLNTNLLQMLAMYRIQYNNLPLDIDEYYLDDIFEELIAKNHLYIENKNLDITIIESDDLSWKFDKSLILELLNDTFINAMKYCQNKILLTAQVVEQQLEISISDDGNGYPASMINLYNNSAPYLSPSLSKTELSLYFSMLIAEQHKNEHGQGRIKLNNGGEYGGSVFTLVLP